MLDWLEQRADWRRIGFWLASFFALAVFANVVLRDHFLDINNGLQMPDLAPDVDSDYLERFLTESSDGALDFYRFVVMPIDVALPVSYAAAFSLLIVKLSGLLSGANQAARRWIRRLAILPLAAFTVDLMENLSVVTNVSIRPTINRGLIDVSVTLTRIKEALLALTLLTTVVLVVVAAIIWARRRFRT